MKRLESFGCIILKCWPDLFDDGHKFILDLMVLWLASCENPDSSNLSTLYFNFLRVLMTIVVFTIDIFAHRLEIFIKFQCLWLQPFIHWTWLSFRNGLVFAIPLAIYISEVGYFVCHMLHLVLISCTNSCLVDIWKVILINLAITIIAILSNLISLELLTNFLKLIKTSHLLPDYFFLFLIFFL